MNMIDVEQDRGALQSVVSDPDTRSEVHTETMPIVAHIASPSMMLCDSAAVIAVIGHAKTNAMVKL
jgi:hypothetical protein